jgi:P27 family predicted phage terminase small subunit
MGQRGPIGNESLRLLRGTAREDEAAKRPAARVPGSVKRPACPEGVSPAVAAEWRKVVAVLAKEGRLTPGGEGLILAYCGAVANLAEAERLLADGGGIMQPVGPNGYRQVRQEVTLARRARAEILKLGAALGLSPAADARIPKAPKNDGKKKDRDAWDNF